MVVGVGVRSNNGIGIVRNWLMHEIQTKVQKKMNKVL